MIINFSCLKVRSIVFSIFFISLLIFIIFQMATLIESYFNTKEINYLVDKADNQNLSYEVIIHNPRTNSYSFQILDK